MVARGLWGDGKGEIGGTWVIFKSVRLFCMILQFYSFIFRIIYLFIYFLEREEGREKEGERNTNRLLLTRPQWGTQPATQACTVTGN